MGWDSSSGTCTIIGGVHRWETWWVPIYCQGGDLWPCYLGSLSGHLSVLHPHCLQASKLQVTSAQLFSRMYLIFAFLQKKLSFFSFVSCRKALLKASLKCQQSVSVEGKEALKFPKIARILSHQSFEQVVSGNLPGSKINERRRLGLGKQMSVDTNLIKQADLIKKIGLRKQISVDTNGSSYGTQMGLGKQMSVDTNVLEADRRLRGELRKQKSVDTDHRQKMFQVDLIKQADLIKRADLTKQVSISSAPCTPTGKRKALDKRLKKEQGMTILVNLIWP